MADEKKTTTEKAKPVPLARAAEATDPAVHHLLAEIQTARMNEDTGKVAALTAQLADLGYE